MSSEIKHTQIFVAKSRRNKREIKTIESFMPTQVGFATK